MNYLLICYIPDGDNSTCGCCSDLYSSDGFVKTLSTVEEVVNSIVEFEEKNRPNKVYSQVYDLDDIPHISVALEYDILTPKVEQLLPSVRKKVFAEKEQKRLEKQRALELEEKRMKEEYRKKRDLEELARLKELYE